MAKRLSKRLYKKPVPPPNKAKGTHFLQVGHFGRLRRTEASVLPSFFLRLCVAQLLPLQFATAHFTFGPRWIWGLLMAFKGCRDTARIWLESYLNLAQIKQILKVQTPKVG